MLVQWPELLPKSLSVSKPASVCSSSRVTMFSIDFVGFVRFVGSIAIA